jgi:hypothetical protein
MGGRERCVYGCTEMCIALKFWHHALWIHAGWSSACEERARRSLWRVELFQ